eukprot:1160237-Pelagomonas_calceolata.AAC.1
MHLKAHSTGKNQANIETRKTNAKAVSALPAFRKGKLSIATNAATTALDSCAYTYITTLVSKATGRLRDVVERACMSDTVASAEALVFDLYSMLRTTKRRPRLSCCCNADATKTI